MKDFIVLDWCVADICNMNCEYCISSDIKKSESTYKMPDDKTVLDIAGRIVELSGYVKRIRLNLCGGEPLLAGNIDQAIEILSRQSNIELVLLTNFKLIDKVQSYLGKFRAVLISVHIRYRTEEEITSMIDKINILQPNENVSLSQVDYNLSEKNISELARINYFTNKSVNLLTYNLPIVHGLNNNISKPDHYKSPFGKACLIGNMFFNITSDGILNFGLWCHKKQERRKTSFLSSINRIVEIINNNTFTICPFSYCPCNYNTTFYDDYLLSIQKFNPDNLKLFKKETRRKKAILLNQVNVLKIENNLRQLQFNHLKEQLSATELSFENLKRDYAGMKSTWSWKIGFFITESIKYLFGWTPLVKNYLKRK